MIKSSITTEYHARVSHASIQGYKLYFDVVVSNKAEADKLTMSSAHGTEDTGVVFTFRGDHQQIKDAMHGLRDHLQEVWEAIETGVEEIERRRVSSTAG